MIEINGNSLTLEQLAAVSRENEQVALAPDAVERIKRSRKTIEDILASGRAVYGINTGFGKLVDVRIPPEELRQLQINLVRSHCCGVGEPLDEPTTRAMMLLRANVLAKGHSGVRTVVAERLVEMLNAGVHPVIPSKGSVGASGDLAPLAHLALGLIGEGEVTYKGTRIETRKAMTAAGLQSLDLEAKEGLALINGTQAMAALGSLAVLEAEALVHRANTAASMTLEALRGSLRAFDERIQAVRPHSGQIKVAAEMLYLLRESEVVESHRNCGRVQDAYSLRCIPQVHGAVLDVAAHVRRVLEIEINSATDNPLVFPDSDEVISGGNFHGEPIAMALDYLGIAVSELASISERRIERMVNADLSEGLPPFLIKNPGINSGFMIAQVTAVALVSENKVLSHPASVDNMTTSGNREDHVSMGMTSALKLKQILDNVNMVIAIEALCAAQGLDFLLPLKPGKGAFEAYKKVRESVPYIEHDAVLANYINLTDKTIKRF